MKLGGFLKDMLNKTNYSIRELARKADINHSYLSRLIRGEVKTPSPDILKKIADQLPCSYTELMIKAGYLNNDSARYIVNQEEILRLPVLKGFDNLESIVSGSPIISEDFIIDYRTYINPGEINEKLLYLKVSKDFITNGTVNEDDLVLVKRVDNINDGDLAVILFDENKVAITRVHIQGENIILQSGDRPVILNDEECKVIGKVIRIELNN
ncbi:MAG: LexA family protein [Halanaerobiales bacterium]